MIGRLHFAALAAAVVSGSSASTTQPHTIYAYGNASNPTRTVASLPSVVRGVSWTFHWSDIEPTQGTYKWASIDAALAASSASGRTAMIRVIAGSDSPSWVQPTARFYDYPGGNVPPHWVTIPLVWESSYLNPLHTFIAAYGARYNGDSRISIVQMPGPGILGEMTLGSWNSAPNPPKSLGATDANMESAWETTIAAYRAAFPSIPTALDIGDPLSDGVVRPAVVAYAKQAFGDRVFVQQNGLGRIKTSTKTFRAILAASAYTTVGWQEWAGGLDASQLAASFSVAEQSNASYVEVYTNDCANPADLAALTTFANS